MPGPHTETAFEEAIEEHLLSSGGYEKGDREAFDPERAIDPDTFLAFVRETQPKEWEYLENLQKARAEPTLWTTSARRFGKKTSSSIAQHTRRIPSQ